MTDLDVRWCIVHDSVVVADEDDPDTILLCAESNRTGDRTPCEIKEGTVTWH